MPTKLLTWEERISKLRGQQSGQARAVTRGDKRRQANRPKNLLYGVALHAGARHAKGQLEQRIWLASGGDNLTERPLGSNKPSLASQRVRWAGNGRLQ